MQMNEKEFSALLNADVVHVRRESTRPRGDRLAVWNWARLDRPVAVDRVTHRFQHSPLDRATMAQYLACM